MSQSNTEEMNRQKKVYKGNPIFFMYRKLWEFSNNKKQIVLYSFMAAISQGLFALYPLILAKMLNIIQLRGLTSETLPMLLGLASLFIIIELISWAFHGPARVMQRSNTFIVSANFKRSLLDGVMSLPASWHTNHHSGDTIDKINKASEGLNAFGEHNHEVVHALMKFLVSFIVILTFDFPSAVIVLFMVFIAVTIALRMDRTLVKRYDRLNRMRNDISAKVYDAISNITTIVILRVEKLMSKSLAKKIFKPYSYAKQTRVVNEWKWFYVSICVHVMIALVIGIYIYSHYMSGSTIMIGDLAALYGYVSIIGGIFYHFAYRYGDIVKWRTQVANVEGISTLFRERKAKKQIKLFETKWKKIVVNDLRFQYEDEKEKLHLDDVSFTLRRGKRVAFVGASGSGKTTALKVIRELHPSLHSEIVIDGEDIKGGFARISSNIALIPQDPEIFNTTIEENITLGLNRERKKIDKYLKLAKFDKVVERLPQGLQSSIVEKGVNLSGGEKQRLALARGLLASEDKEIVLMDEPTSSVDSKNEMNIYTGIFKAFKKKTIVSSIHRLHLLPLFDQIYLFKKGKIIANGSFDELRASSKEFKSMLSKYERTLKKK